MDVSLSMREDSLLKVICIGNVLLVSGIILYFLCGIAASRIAASALIFGLICVDFTVQRFFGLYLLAMRCGFMSYEDMFGRACANGLCLIPGWFRGYRRRLYRYSFLLFYFENLKQGCFCFSVGNNRRGLLPELIECGMENIGTLACVEFLEEWRRIAICWSSPLREIKRQRLYLTMLWDFDG